MSDLLLESRARGQRWVK